MMQNSPKRQPIQPIDILAWSKNHPMHLHAVSVFLCSASFLSFEVQVVPFAMLSRLEILARSPLRRSIYLG